MGGVTRLAGRDDREHTARFEALKQKFIDGTINEDTPLMIYYDQDLGDGYTAGDLVLVNIKQFEVCTYLEMIKAMIMEAILMRQKANE